MAKSTNFEHIAVVYHMDLQHFMKPSIQLVDINHKYLNLNFLCKNVLELIKFIARYLLFVIFETRKLVNKNGMIFNFHIMHHGTKAPLMLFCLNLKTITKDY